MLNMQKETLKNRFQMTLLKLMMKQLKLLRLYLFLIPLV